MVDPELGLTVVFNGCIYNYPALRAELEGHGLPLLLHQRHRGDPQGATTAGASASSTTSSACSPSASSSATAGRAVLARDRLGIKPLYLHRRPGAPAVRVDAARPGRRRAASTATIDPVALHHYLTFHAVVPAPRTILADVEKLPPATMLVVEPDGRPRQHEYWRPTAALDAGTTAGLTTDGEWQEAVEAALRIAVERRLVADVPVGVLLSGGLDSSLIVGLLAEHGQHGLSTFSIGFESIGGEEGDEFRWSDLVAERFGTDHHRFVVPTAEVLSTIPADRRRHERADGEPRRRRLLPAVPGGRPPRQGRAVRPGRRRGVRRLPLVPDPRRIDTGDGDRRLRLGLLRPGPRRRSPTSSSSPTTGSPTTSAGRSSPSTSPGPARATPLERALRIDTQVMLVEDPVKRVDNMTMAWGLEARVPFLDHELVELAVACPAAPEGGRRRQGRAQGHRPVGHPPRGHRPAQGLLPGAAARPPRRPLRRPAARRPHQRGRQGAGAVPRRARPGPAATGPTSSTRLRYNQLWELGLLELWLQTHGIG